MKKILFTLLALFIVSPLCFAFNYQSSCHYLDSISGLSTSGDSMGCMSNYKMLDSYRSNLAYYTEGTTSYINDVYLVLNVYNGSNKASVHNSLIQASKLLSKKAINYDLPQSIITCLQTGRAGAWKHGKYTIKVTRENFPSGNGYEVHFKIEE